MSYNEALSETLAVVGQISPQIVDNGAVNMTAIDMKNLRRVMFILTTGAIDTTVDVKLQRGNASDGSDAVDISGKAITQLADTADNKAAIIEIAAEEMGAYRYVRAVLTAGNGTVGAYAQVVALGGYLRYSPAEDYDAAAVVQIVN